MDAVFAFQQSLREPVFNFLGQFWPFVGVVLLFGACWLFFDYARSGAPTGFELDGNSEGGDGGGDGGD
ncbi:hypothetical protein [Devosia sp.]|uniref:hypothetical protein n=1 Tax=Devosia sp. TaxID=1871048 RepID=UPI003A93D4A1